MLFRLKEVLSMNKRGQSLITFIIILPLITLFLAFFIDSSLSIVEKNKIDGIITSNMQNALDNDIVDIDRIKDVIIKNTDISIDIELISDTLRIDAKATRKSIFAKVLKSSWYNLKFNYCGNYVSKKIDKHCV